MNSTLRISALLASLAATLAVACAGRPALAADAPSACASPTAPGSTGGGEGCTPPAVAPGKPGEQQRNLRGGPLATCSTTPLTGWFRDGRCATDEEDRGSHTVCAIVDEAFLSFTRSRGNDLVTPREGFPGLRPGDRWCLCAGRWEEARRAGVTAPVVVDATHESATRAADRDALLAAAVR